MPYQHTSLWPKIRRGTRRRLIWVAFGWLVASASSAWGQDPFPLERVPVTLRLELAELYFQDVNADRREDLILLEVDRSRRSVRAFLRVLVQKGIAGQGINFRDTTSQPMLLPGDVLMLNPAMTPTGPALAVVRPGWLELWPWENNRFNMEAARKLKVDSLFNSTGGEPITGWDWVVDLNHDGVSEFMLPQFDGMVLVTQEGAELQQKARMGYRVDMGVSSGSGSIMRFSQPSVSYRLPSVFFVQANGEGWLDLLVYDEGLTQLYFLSENVSGDVKPSYSSDFQPPKPFNLEDEREMSLDLVAAGDFNQDHRLDLLFRKSSGYNSSLSTTTWFYAHYGTASDRRYFNEEPDQSWEWEGLALPFMLDMNHDGRLDLITVFAEISLWGVASAWSSGTTSAEGHYLLMQPNGQFLDESDEVFQYEVGFETGRGGHQPIVIFEDVNTDGIPDLLLSISPDEMGVHFGQLKEPWPEDPDMVIEAHLPTRSHTVYARDLNGDGRTDLILTYSREDRRKMPDVDGTLVVVFPLPLR